MAISSARWRMNEQLVPFDMVRMLWGDVPALFYLEIVFRSIIGYLYCFLLIRLLSGRALAQISMTDLVLVIALGSAVGDMAFYADVPIFQALLVITVVILLTKFLDRSMHRWRWAKQVLENVPVVLVRDGVIDIDGAASRDMNPLEVMERLRLKGVRNLGEVEWAFLEPDGSVSLFTRSIPLDGLAIVPPLDLDPPPVEHDEPDPGGRRCCRVCGMVAAPGAPAEMCENCAAGDWAVPSCSRAVIDD